MDAELHLQLITANLGKVRRETLNGRDYLVAPATLIVGDQTLNGSQGPLKYPKAENERSPQAWNGMPLVAWHPTKVVNGEKVHVSARDPKIIDEWGMGQFFHANELATHVPGNLDGEAWFDVENVKRVDAKLVQMKLGDHQILPRAERGEPIELSTGLFTKNVKAADGTVLATNYRPDHVAILPDEVGACSVEMGCGVNNQTTNTWSDAAREAAAAARAASAKASAGVSGIESRSIAAKAASDRALEMTKGALRPGGSGRDAARAHTTAAEMHRQAASSSAKEGDIERAGHHRMAAESHDRVAGHHDPELFGGSIHNKSQQSSFARRVLNTIASALGFNEPSDSVSSDKACEIMKDGTVHGQPLTDAQKGMFGAACGSIKDNESTLPSAGATYDENEHLPWDECIAKAMKEYGSQDAAEKTCGAIKAGTANQATNRRNDMRYTPDQRKKIVKDLLTTNCPCKEKTLNAMDDDELEQTRNQHTLVLVVNAAKRKPKIDWQAIVANQGEGEAVPGVPWKKLAQTLSVETDMQSDPTGWIGEMKKVLQSLVDKLSGSTPAEDAIDQGADDATEMQPTTASTEKPMETHSAGKSRLTREEQEDLAFARQVRNSRKEEIVRELISDAPLANRKALGDLLWQKPMAELEQLRLMRPDRQIANVAATKVPDWSLAAGGAPGDQLTDNEAASDQEDWELMTAGQDHRAIVNEDRQRRESA